MLDPALPSPVLLRAPGAIIGGFPEARYEVGRHTLAPGSRLYVFSDGVYELARDSGKTVQLEEFVAELGRSPAAANLGTSNATSISGPRATTDTTATTASSARPSTWVAIVVSR